MKKESKAKQNPQHLKEVKGTKKDELNVKGSTKGFPHNRDKKGDRGYGEGQQ